MTVSVTQKGKFLRISGTIAEVLQEWADQRIMKAIQVAYYSDDNTDAKSIVCRIA